MEVAIGRQAVTAWTEITSALFDTLWYRVLWCWKEMNWIDTALGKIVIPVETPFGEVAMRIVQAPGVRR